MFAIPEDRYAIRRTKDRGRGAFATRDIVAGTVIGDYLGTLVRPADENEKKHGLYQMSGGARYDMLPDPRSKGVHLINDSCANNCAMYPYLGHILYVATRLIFKGEELTVAYDIDPSDDCDVSCEMHACHCGSRLCTATMHVPRSPVSSKVWETLKKREFGPYYRLKIPGTIGKALSPLQHYPKSVPDQGMIWDMFGAEEKKSMRCVDKVVPSIPELRTCIRATGRTLVFPALRLRVLGIRNGTLIAERS